MSAGFVEQGPLLRNPLFLDRGSGFDWTANPNYPHHIVQCGHNRQTVFADEDDYRYYLDNLAAWTGRYRCQVFAFGLMTNHVHLVVDPGEDPEALGKLMKRLAGRQTRYVNRLEGRSGTLW
jgi:putative transposase